MSTTPLTAWRMPIARNLHFAGRETTVLELRVRLANRDEFSRVQAVCGPGGVGKTQTAVEYAYRFRSSYGIVWYIAACDKASVEVSLGQLARTLGLSDRSDASTHELRDLLFNHLAGREDWLLIYDDAPDAASLEGMLPPRSGNVIVTSRNANWLQIGRSFPLGVFTRPESVAFLHSRTGRNEDPDVTDRLAKALGDMPVALDQAAALIEQARISFADYLARFESHWAELLKMGKTSADYPMTVSMSWELSFKQVEEAHPQAADLLALCAFLGPDIPRELLRQMAPFAPPAAAPLLDDPVATGQALSHLADYSLIEFDERTIRMQPLAAGLSRDRLGEPEHRTWSSVAARTIESVFKFDANALESWQLAAELLPHALAAGGHADRAGSAPSAVRSVYNQAGHYLLAMARYDQARKLLERAWDIALQLWGEASPRLSPIANNLGRVLLRTGDPDTARDHFERALKLDRQTYGPAHLHVAEVMNNRGVCLHALGAVESAESDFRQALAIYEMNDAPAQAKIAAIVNNLGFALIGRGDFDGAREQFSSALAIAQSSAGATHPIVATVLRNLGKVCHVLGQFADAQGCFERALEIDETVLGPAHPCVAADLTGLGEALDEQLVTDRARAAYERAVSIDEAQPVRDIERLLRCHQGLLRIYRNLDLTELAKTTGARVAELKAAPPRVRPRADDGLTTFAITP